MKLAIKTILLLVVLVTGLSIRVTYAQTNKADRALIADSHLNEFDDYMNRVTKVAKSEVNFEIRLPDFQVLDIVNNKTDLDTVILFACQRLKERVETTDSFLADFKKFSIRAKKQKLGNREKAMLAESLKTAFLLKDLSTDRKEVIHKLNCAQVDTAKHIKHDQAIPTDMEVLIAKNKQLIKEINEAEDSPKKDSRNTMNQFNTSLSTSELDSSTEKVTSENNMYVQSLSNKVMTPMYTDSIKFMQHDEIVCASLHVVTDLAESTLEDIRKELASEKGKSRGKVSLSMQEKINTAFDFEVVKAKAKAQMQEMKCGKVE